MTTMAMTMMTVSFTSRTITITRTGTVVIYVGSSYCYGYGTITITITIITAELMGSETHLPSDGRRAEEADCAAEDLLDGSLDDSVRRSAAPFPTAVAAEAVAYSSSSHQKPSGLF